MFRPVDYFSIENQTSIGKKSKDLIPKNLIQKFAEADDKTVTRYIKEAESAYDAFKMTKEVRLFFSIWFNEAGLF